MATLTETTVRIEITIAKRTIGEDTPTSDVRIIASATTYLADGTPIRTLYKDITNDVAAAYRTGAQSLFDGVTAWAKQALQIG